MRYKLLGQSGLRVSELCLGAVTFGSDEGWCASPEESRAIFDTFVEAGGNFLDTSNIYTHGASEKLIGEFANTDRDRFVVASKYSFAYPGQSDPNAAGNHRKSLVRSLDASLKNMNLDYIDLYWIHGWDFSTPVEEVMRALDDAVRSGKILHIGISNAPAWLVCRANTLAEQHGWTRFSAMQLEYSLAERTIELELVPMCRALNISVLAWASLAAGVLTGKYTRAANNDSRRADHSSYFRQSEKKLAIARVVDTVADEIGASSSQVALAWVLKQNIIPIVGARTKAQIEENLKCLDVQLDAKHMEALDNASALERGHPYDAFDRDAIQQIAYGGMMDKIDNLPPYR